ncbi:MAG: TDP-N-acetylfucosamine:lipid II N-acetylfucosaminyltransferase, partial [Odoribacter sp.]|nr:TDP-N-acetylfucosamine:lipid II N-acetylfucosaminyltransferase [Odoribacter sp.]
VIAKADFFKRKDRDVFSAVVIHLLNTRKIRFIKKCGLKDIPVYWIIWGADLYNKLLYPKGFEMYYRSECFYTSHRILKSLSIPFQKIRTAVRVNKTMEFVRSRVNYLVTDTTENDYEKFIQYYPEIKKIPWRDFFYYPIDEILGETLMNAQVSGNNILIGNSGSLTNNHEYAYKYLSGLNLGNRKLIVPLSYSGSKNYKRIIIERGKNLFGENFCPLTDFLPLAAYNELMTGAAVAIYANWRQEAIGNIIIALYLGAKVFISSRNPVLAWARGHRLIVSELEALTQQELDTPLTAEEKSNNRHILAQLYNRERFFTLVKDTFQLERLL